MSSVRRMLEFIEFQGMKKTQFYVKTGLSNGYFDKVKELGADKIESIISVFPEINLNWLITGKGPMIFKEKTYETNVVSESSVDYGAKKIPLLPFSAFAGKGLGRFKDLTIERMYTIHEFHNADFLISIKGDSMHPKYSNGDIIACQLVKDRLFMQWNKPHVIYTESQGVLVKRIRKSSINNCIQCVSDNLDYDPFDVPIDDIVDVAIVIGAIRLE